MENALVPPINLVENCIKITLEVMDKVTKGDGFGSGLVALLKKPMNELIMLAKLYATNQIFEFLHWCRRPGVPG